MLGNLGHLAPAPFARRLIYRLETKIARLHGNLAQITVLNSLHIVMFGLEIQLMAALATHTQGPCTLALRETVGFRVALLSLKFLARDSYESVPCRLHWLCQWAQAATPCV